MPGCSGSELLLLGRSSGVGRAGLIVDVVGGDGYVNDLVLLYVNVWRRPFARREIFCMYR